MIRPRFTEYTSHRRAASSLFGSSRTIQGLTQAASVIGSPPLVLDLSWTATKFGDLTFVGLSQQLSHAAMQHRRENAWLAC
jgi:hypothetical protein